MKTIEEKIKVMQAFADGKVVESRANDEEEWGVVTGPIWDWRTRDYRVKQGAPRTWEEFCKQNNKVCDEYYLHADGHILPSRDLTFRRHCAKDALLLKNKEDAKGLLALIKLKRLRDAWWGDWRPDLTSVHYDYSVCKNIKRWEVSVALHYKHFLVFETKEMAEDFLECFKDLINKAEMWL